MKCCDITAGMLRHTVAIQQYSDVADGGGGAARAWADLLAAVQGRLRPVSGRERFHADQLESVITHDFVTRYTTAILPKQRLVYAGRYFNVRAVINVEERNRWLRLLLEEGVAT